MMRVLLSQLLFALSLLTLPAQVGSTANDAGVPTIYDSDVWKELKPGNVYQGSIKLNSAWNNNWPLQWLTTGDHITFTRVPAEWASKHYFGKQKQSRIYDPQQYLTATDREVLRGIIKKHEDVSHIPIHLCIFGADQRVEHLMPELMCRPFFGNTNAALMYYFVGDSRASIGFVNTKLEGEIEPDAEPLLDSFLVKAMFSKAGNHAASLKTDPKETMYATVAEVSRRMYWIEQELGLVKSTKLLIDDNEGETEDEDEPSMMDKLWQQFGGAEKNLTYFTIGILIATCLVLSALMLMIYRRFKVYHFPLYEGAKRLDAEYGAGVGRVVHFKDAREAPHDQKKRLENNEI